MSSQVRLFGELLSQIKTRIWQAQSTAVLAANAELLYLYLDIGRMLVERQQKAGWVNFDEQGWVNSGER